jgi:hypothetical protein
LFQLSIDLEITARLAAIAERLEFLSGIEPSAALRRDVTITSRLKRIEDSLAAGVLEAHLLSSHLDVDAFDATDGQMLKYDFDAEMWINTSKLQVDQIDFSTEVSEPERKEGRLWYDPVGMVLNLYPGGEEVTHQLGQEVLGTIPNNSGEDILNGEVFTLTAAGSVEKAIASNEESAIGVGGMATELIEDGTIGKGTVLGVVNGVDTSAWAVNTVLYLSDSVAGAVTDVIPESPSFHVRIGIVIRSHATAGAIYVRLQEEGNQQGIAKVFNGACLEPYTNSVESDGADITCTIEADVGTDLSLIFEEGLVTFVTPASVILTEGTDEVPVLNYVYIPESTLTLTKSTVGFPTDEEFQPVATVFCQSAASVQTDTVLKNHSWNDHLGGLDSNGHLSDINVWIRSQHATWLTGAVPSITDGATSYFAMTEGTALQLHINPIDDLDMAAGHPVYIMNDPVSPYLRSVDLVADITVDSTGGSLDNKFFILTFMGIVNSDGHSQVIVHLPSGTYNSQVSAEQDALGYANFMLPTEFRGTGFLLGKVVIRLQGGSFTEYGMVDLRGALIGSTATGGAGAALLSLVDLTDTTIVAPADLEFMVHDGTDWKNRIMALGDLPAIGVDDLSDVVITAAATGEYLRYDGANWVDDGIILADLPAIALGDLSDVTGSPSTNSLLLYSSGWKANLATYISRINQLLDVTITSVAHRDVLTYNSGSTDFENFPKENLIWAAGDIPLTGDWDVGNYKITMNQLEVDTDSILTGEVTVKADLIFDGAGSGLSFGEIYKFGNGVETILNSAADVQILIFGVNGPSNNTTPDHTHDHITILEDGYYQVTCSIIYSNRSGGGQFGHWQIERNNGSGTLGSLAQNFSIPTASDFKPLHMTGIVQLAAADTIEVWMGTNVAADRAMRVSSITLTVTQVGGVA